MQPKVPCGTVQFHLSTTANASTANCKRQAFPRKSPGSSGFEIDTHTAAQRCRDIDRRVKRKAGNPPPEQIVNPKNGS
jgi:hypothetical protein